VVRAVAADRTGEPARNAGAGALRLVFAGTPAVAVPALHALLESRHELIAVLTRPPAAAGRGRQVSESPVARLAAERGLPVLTPGRPSEPGFLARLAELAPDCVPVVAYGALVPPAALAIPATAWINLHFSLLPAWRGAAPVQQAIRHGDEVTGATTFRLEAGMDTGPVYGVVTEPIGPRDTTGDLLGRLSVAGAQLLVATLDGVSDGSLVAVPQPAEGVSYAPKVGADDVRVNWALPALAVDRLIRSGTPAPGAWSTWRGARLKLGPVRPTAGHPAGALPPGVVEVGRDAVLVGTATTPVTLGEVQPAGRRAVPASDWARGARPAGERLG